MQEAKIKQCVIVGASHGGCQAAESVRKSGWQGDIILLGDEALPPYHRPPLSKEVLMGRKQAEDLAIRPLSWYEKNNIQLRLNTRIVKIDRVANSLLLECGEKLNYDKLVLAVGARPRVLTVPGESKKGVHYLRSVADVQRIKKSVHSNAKAVIIGGGYIGLETAAALTSLGLQVTILEMMPRILERVTASNVSEFYHRVHMQQGVKISTEVTVSEIAGGESVTSVIGSKGERYEADLVIIGVGVIPNTEVANDAGIEVNVNGIVTDNFTVTSDPNIFAIGDCSWQHNSTYDRWVRIESVPNAMDQARVAGASVNGIFEKPHHQLPWFWSDQYDLKLQIAGLSQGFDNIVIRGDIDDDRKFAAFYFQADTLLAVDAINMPAAFMFGKRVITSAIEVDKAKLADTNIDLKSLL